MGKKTDQRKHAKRRAYERYDLELSDHQYKSLCRKIQKVPQSEDVELVEKQSNNRRVYKIDHQGQKLKVVYDRKYSQIATFMPKVDSKIDRMIAEELH